MSPLKKIRTAVIPVAGMGTRLMPITKAIPKELVPIYDRPVIQHIAEEAIDAGIEKIVFVISPGKEAIRDHFTHDPKLKETLIRKQKHHIVDNFEKLENAVEFVFVYQNDPLGDGHAVLQALPELDEDESIVVLFGDDLVDNHEGPNAVEQMMQKYHSHQSPVILLQEVPEDETHRYGIVAVDDDHRIEIIIEKPAREDAPSNLGVVGKYILTPQVLLELQSVNPHSDGEIRLSGAFDSLVKKGHAIHGRPLEGKRFDTGHLHGLVEATLHFFGKSTHEKPTLKNILGLG